MYVLVCVWTWRKAAHDVRRGQSERDCSEVGATLYFSAILQLRLGTPVGAHWLDYGQGKGQGGRTRKGEKQGKTEREVREAEKEVESLPPRKRVQN